MTAGRGGGREGGSYTSIVTCKDCKDPVAIS